jgi:hypothetical protein
MASLNKKVDGRILAIAIISTTIVVGNIFLLSWSWGHNPVWVSIITTLVAFNSLFAWVVAIALMTDSET